MTLTTLLDSHGCVGGYTPPFQQHNYIGEHANDTCAATFVTNTLGWSLVKSLFYYNTTTDTFKYYDGSSWLELWAGSSSPLWTDGGDYLYPSSSERIAIGSTNDPGVGVSMESTNVATSGSASAIKATYTTTTDMPTSLLNVSSTITTDTTGTVTPTEAFCYYGKATFDITSGTTTLGELHGLFFGVEILDSSVTITDLYGVRVKTFDGTGTITDAFGVYIEQMYGDTNSYGVYQVSENDGNYFAGDTVVGPSYGTPSARLTAQENGTGSSEKAFRANYTTTGSMPSSLVVSEASINTSTTGTLTPTEAYLFYGKSTLDITSGTMTLGELDGVFSGLEILDASVTVTTFYGFRTKNFDATGTVTTAYGLYIDSMYGDTSWGVYQAASADTNYFAGDTYIGTTTPSGRRLTVEDADLAASFQVNTATTVTTIEGISSTFDINSGHTVTNGYNIRVYPSTGTGALTNGYMLYLADQGTATPTITNSYAIYQAGEGDQNYFGGPSVFDYSPSSATSGVSRSNVESVFAHGSTGTITEFAAYEATISATGGGMTATSVYGLLHSITNLASGDVVVSSYGLYSQNGAGSGQITNAYGVYIGTQDGTTLSYGVYQADTSDSNYFAGAVGLGTAPGSAELTVADASQAAAFYIDSPSSGSGVLIGTATQIDVNSGYTASIVYANYVQAPTGSGTLTNYYAIRVESNSTGPTAQDGYGLWVGDLKCSSVAYGLYVASQTVTGTGYGVYVASQSGDYAMYLAGSSDRIYMAGEVVSGIKVTDTVSNYLIRTTDDSNGNVDKYGISNEYSVSGVTLSSTLYVGTQTVATVDDSTGTMDYIRGVVSDINITSIPGGGLTIGSIRGGLIDIDGAEANLTVTNDVFGLEIIIDTTGTTVSGTSAALAIDALGTDYVITCDDDIQSYLEGDLGVGVSSPSSKLDVAGDVELSGAVYLGDPTTDGSWRMIRSGNDLLFQRRESSSWVTKQTISA